MTKLPRRARRRGDKARMKRKARRLYPWDKTGKYADHLAVCSCGMGCGNPRRYFNEVTRQEEKADLKLREALHDVARETDAH